MAEIDRVDEEGYVEPTYEQPSEDMQTRMRGIRKRYERCVEAERSLRDAGLEAFRFAWVQGSQWDGNLAQRRGNRPKYEFNKLGQAILQVINANRQQTPSIKVRATKESTKDMADIRQGLIRNIESMSHADAVYDWGSLYAITSGFGGWEVTADYADDASFEQDLFIRRIKNPLTSLWFGPCEDELKRDAPYAFKEFNLTWESFREQFPKADFQTWGDAKSINMEPGWVSEAEIRVCDYWYKKLEEREILLLSDGRVVDSEDWDEEKGAVDEDNTLSQNALSASAAPVPPGGNGPAQGPGAAPGQAPPNPPPSIGTILGQPVPPRAPVKVVQRRKVQKQCVYKEIVSGCEVLDGPFEWKGRFIPLVPCFGNVINDDGQEVWFGMVSWSADAQRLYNYNRSNSVEIMANQSRSPYLYTPAMIAGFEDQWKNMAVLNQPGLPYNPDSSAPGGRPSREPPPQFPAGMLEASNVDDNDIKATTGIWQANLGQPSNETSGRAIQNRQRQGLTATYHYQDAIAKAVAYTGEIIDDLIPYYYDTYREIRILGPDGAEKYLEVNKPVWNPDAKDPMTGLNTGAWEKLNDLSEGKYDITSTVGPSYATQRMETLDAMLQMAQAGGPLAELYRYGALKNMDVPGMDDVTEATRVFLVKNGILPPDQDDPPPPPPQPNPKDVADAQKAQAQALAYQAQAGKYQTEARKNVAETQRTEVETHVMAASAPTEVAKSHADLATATAGAAAAQIDAAWQQAHNEARYDKFNNQALTDLANQQTITPPN